MKAIVKALYRAGAHLVPQRLKPLLMPVANTMRHFFEPAAAIASVPTPPLPELATSQPRRPRVLHVIGNFMLGGSSRLVMDIVENLGDEYDHHVVTSCQQSPPAYTGVTVTEIRHPQSPEDAAAVMRAYQPDLVHVHYWGDCDFWWYDLFFKAAHLLNCRVIENINTPVEPYHAGFISRYVYVSHYVQQQFGVPGAPNMTIYPGSDLTFFSRRNSALPPDNTIGMVYRLENDKLNAQSINVFVKVAQRRPNTRVIIVGGGSNLDVYRKASARAGVEANFEFTGYVDYATLPDWYERMSMFVAPVWKESFGQVSPFAMNMHIPVVGYNVGGIAEIVQDDSLLAEPENSDALADIVVALLDNPERRLAIGTKNHQRAQAVFSIEAMVKAYRCLYAESLAIKK